MSICTAGLIWHNNAFNFRACLRASAGSVSVNAIGWVWHSIRLVANGELKAPIVIGRDHLDSGSVASPNRETEAMLDGSDAVRTGRCSTPC